LKNPFGEGVAYTGLKPAETEVEPGIEAADKALPRSSVEKRLKQVNETIHHTIHEQFTNAMAKKKFDANNVEACREYVKAYVEFIHYVERLHEAATKPAEGHLHEAGRSDTHEGN